MKLRLLSVGLAGVMAFGGTAVVAAADGPGPNDHNNRGLCTAFFNGQKNGHDNDNAGGNGDGNGRQPGEQPPPFQSLSDTAGDMGVHDFCMETAGSIGGNPDHGRYPECFDGDEDTTQDENNACPGDEG